jgi:hypothetical protein
VDKTRAVYSSPLNFKEKYSSFKRLFEAPSTSVAYLVRLKTPASEVREYWKTEPKYLKL